jgi:uroporphyrinogen decarboxylase
MDSRERVIRCLKRQRPDRVPMYDAHWEDTLTRWYGEGLPQDVNLEDYFGFDIAHMSVDASPRMPQKVLSQDAEYITYQDRYGYTVRKSVGKSRTMLFSDHVTADRAAWERVRKGFAMPAGDTARIDSASYFMHLDDYPSWEEARRRYEEVRRQGRYLLFVAYGSYEATWRHRGFEPLLMDMAQDPDFVGEMAGAYMDFLVTVLQRCLDEGMRPDGFFMVEDLAYTQGMLMSPRTWRRVFKGPTAKLGQFLRQNDIAFWMHCCGNAEAVFEDLIECGLQVIQPLEAKSGLDVRRLRPKYGSRLTFYGNMDVINMAKGSDAEVAEEIRSKITPFIEDGGGYIYHSDHSVPPEVSFQRYLHVLELVRRYGTYK